ncbi:MAG: MFS transporter [Dehalococcoidia bacterium]|nr:MFS transporter [Dehalococcoidia bacterium]
MRTDSTPSSEEDGASPARTGDSEQTSSIRQTSRRNNSRARSATLPPSNTQTRGWRQTFSSLNNRAYLFLWLGMMAMMGGMQMQMLARGYLVYDITGSASLLGFVSAGMAIPMLFLAPFGGVIADRVERKRLIQGGQFIVAIFALIIGAAIFTDRIEWYHLLIVSILQGTVWTFMMPARQAIIPQIVGPERIGNAMALNAAGMSAMTLIAPAVAGGLYAWAGPANVYFIISGLSILSVAVTTLVPKPEGSAAPSQKRNMFADIGAGLMYIKGNSMVLVLLVMGLATTLLASPFRMLLPVFVVDIYHRGPDSMGLLVAIMGGGSLVGSLAIAALGDWRRGMLLIVGSFISGAALLLIAAFPLYYAGAIIMVLVGLGDAGRRTINMGLIMEVVEDQYRGRVMSVFMMNFGLMPLGVLPAGMIADALGGQEAIAILGALLILVTLVVLVTQKGLRSFQ